MKKLQMLKRVTGKWQLIAGMFAMALMLTLFWDGFSMVSRADSQAKITATSAKVRKEATTKSDQVGSVLKDETVTIVGQTQGEGGYIWYQVVTDENQSGYIRSDLMQVIETAVDVTKVNPISGTVKGSSTVRVRSNASTSSEIVTTVASGTTLTVTGKATASDGKVWYQVNFNVDGSQVEGFIRYDYVELSGELTPYTEPPVAPTEEPTVQEPVVDPGTTEPQNPEPAVPDVEKVYDTMLQDGTWFLVKTETNEGWDIQGLFDGVQKNADAYKESEKTVKSQKVVIIILVFLLVAAAAGVGFLVFKMKDMMDSAYFSQVEAETIRRRNNAAGQGNKRVMHTVGDDKKPTRPGTPQGQRPAGAAQGQKPVGAPQGQKTAGGAQGQRPAGAAQGQRPAGGAQGQRPAGAPQGQRPAGAAQGTKPVGAPQGTKPAGAKANDAAQAPKSGAQGWQSKNFAADDDEFEFEFLNYEGEDEK